MHDAGNGLPARDGSLTRPHRFDPLPDRGTVMRRDLAPTNGGEMSAAAVGAATSTGRTAMDHAASVEMPISFGRFRLFPRQRLLLDGEKQVRLGSRALELLVTLIERPGELVRKDELIARVWPDTIVVEDNLAVHIAAVRRALGDGSGGKRYLVTVPGRGYCFVGRVTRQRAAGAPHQASPARRQPHNLPASLAPLIGRADVIRHLGDQLPRRRMLTIVGAGGIGKTSVAIAVAEEQMAKFEDGVWLVDLASIGDAALVATASAGALGLEVRSGDPLLGLIDALHDRRMLIVLDNCAHVVAGAASFTLAVLRGAPGVCILATSREPLRVEAEHIHRLSPLEYPPVPGSQSSAQIGAFPAVQLFIERAAASLDGFELDDRGMHIAADICQKLDGIPLAIEFAAAQVGALGMRGLASRLDDLMRFPTFGRRSAATRHRSMRATLDWSYGLLTDFEQRVLRRLAIFNGGFTLRAAGAVAANPGEAEADIAVQVLELAAKSLVSVEARAAEPRLRLPETTRAYALDKLAESGEREVLERRHAEYCLDLLETTGQNHAAAGRQSLGPRLRCSTTSPLISNVISMSIGCPVSRAESQAKTGKDGELNDARAKTDSARPMFKTVALRRSSPESALASYATSSREPSSL